MHDNGLKFMQSAVGAANSPTWSDSSVSLFNAQTSNLGSVNLGSTSLTYPTFIATPSGNMQFFIREGASGGGSWFVFNYTSSANSWDGGHQIDNGFVGTYQGNPQRNAYPNGFSYNNQGQLIETFVWRETASSSNHDVNYVYSNDGGATWLNNAGLTVSSTTGNPSLTFSLTSAGLSVVSISQNSSLMNQQCQAADNNGNIHCIDYSLDPSKSPIAIARPGVPNGFDPQDCTYYQYWRDSLGDWHRDKIPGGISTIYSTRPKIFFDANDNAIAIYGTANGPGGSLVIAEASAASNWTDWQIAYTTSGTAGGYFSEAQADDSQLKTKGILSVEMQDNPTVSAGPSAIHALNFDIALTPAATTSFAAVAGGNWSTSANWSGGIVPTGNMTALIGNGQTANITQAVASVGGDVAIGIAGGNGTLIVSNGSLNVVNTISVGRDGGAVGTYNQTAGAVSAARFVVGDFYSTTSGGGVSTATISGGSLTMGELQVAVSDGTSSSGSSFVVAGSASVVDTGDAIVGDCGNTGSLVLNGGTLTIAGNLMQGLNGASTTVVQFNGGTLDMTGNSMSVTQLVANSGRLQNVGSINNGAALNLSPTGVFCLAGSNTFNNPLNINGGTLSAQSTNALGSGTTTVSGGNASGVLAISGGITLGEPIVLNGRSANSTAAILNVGGSNTVTSPIVATTGGNQYNIQSGAGLLTIGGSFQNTLSGVGDVRNLNLLGSGSGLFSGMIADSAVTPNPSETALWKSGSGMWTLTGVNTYSGSTTIDQGTLQVGASAALPSGAGKGIVAFDNAANTAVLDINGNNVVVNGLSQPAASTTNLVVNNGPGANTLSIGGGNASSTFNGVLADATGGGGSLALTKIGTGTLSIGGANSYSGATTIDQGTLQLGTSAALPSGAGNGIVVFDNATNVAVLDIDGNDVAVNRLSQTTASTTNRVVNNGAGAHTLSLGGGNASSTFNGVLADTTSGGLGGALAAGKNRQRRIDAGGQRHV